jgi:Putative MetA-pathway of phenol degradation
MLSACFMHSVRAQDLAPRAYVITPVHSNAAVFIWSFFDGDIVVNGSVPVTGATGTYHVPIFSYYHSVNFFGRSANITGALPYAVGNFKGTVLGAEQNLYRSGLADSSFRFAVNLKGGPAMAPREFARWRQKVLLGASLKVVAPTGQYDPAKLINWGGNRWAFKPEFGYSERWGKWVLDGYMGVWFFTTNHDFFSRNAFFPGTRSQSQSPIGSFEGHLSYDVKPRLWLSLDGNFWFGGKTKIDGVENPLSQQRSSRVGVTGSFPFGKHLSMKASYSNGAYIRFGGDYQNVSLALQYSWIGRPE